MSGLAGEGPLWSRGLVTATLCLLAAACAPAPDDSNPLPPFAPDTLLLARVVENDTGCEVDGACFLRLQYADTTIIALYGTGERPAPPCPISADVSDAAWGLESGDHVRLRVFDCADEGYFIEEIAS